MKIPVLCALSALMMCAPVFSAAPEQSASKERLKSALQLSNTAWAATKQGYGLIEVKQPGIPFGAVRGYDIAQVDATVQKIRGELTRGLDRGELKGLHAYTQEFFPPIRLQTFDVPDSADTTCSIAPCPRQLVEPESVEEMYGYVHEFVDKVAAATAYKISFKVRSKPSGAKFSLQPLGGGFVTEIATDGSVGNVFRGLYRYTVQREGFKKVEATLNLVDNSPEELFCELTEAKQAQESLPCLFGIIE